VASQYAVSNLARNTLKGYAASWNSHVLPRLGGYRLRDLSPQVIVGFRTELEAAGVGRDVIRKALACSRASCSGRSSGSASRAIP
jgi:hypothetical protein